MKLDFLKGKKEIIRKILKSLACAYVYIAIVVVLSFALFSKKIEQIFKNVEIISVQKKEPTKKEIKINKETKKLTKRPSFGIQYGKIKIEKLDIDVPLLYGTTSDILKNGVGISSRAYCPGEGRSIILTGYSGDGFLKELVKIKKKDEITLEMDYGTFTYKVVGTKILPKDDESVEKAQKEKETLTLYTYYQVGNIADTSKIFVVYAEPVEE